MDTPDRSQIGRSSLSKYEDSPVFSYLSNLSPIQPVRSAPINQTFTSLNFFSLPSIFTSPHAISQKESRFLRHSSPNKLKYESSYIDASSNKENEVIADVNPLHKFSSELLKKSGKSYPLGEASREPLCNESDLPIELSQKLKYGSGSPECDPMSCHSAGEGASLSVEVATSSVMFHLGTSVNGPSLHESPSGWESLISDSANLLMFDSPNIAKDLKTLFKSPLVEHEGSSVAIQFARDSLDFLNTDSPLVVDVGQLQNEAHHADMVGNNCAHDDYPNNMAECSGQPNENLDDEPTTTNFHRGGLRRRCLVFDTNGAHRKKLLGASRSNPSTCIQSDQKASLNTMKQVMNKPVGSSPLCILPRIGLHLNALTTSGDHGVQVNVSSSSSSFQSTTTALESLHDVLTGTSMEKNVVSDASLATGLVSVDELTQNSPRKKRRKPDDSGEESCKRCNCKKSKCLKLYCECFAAGVYCVGTCACQDCFNKPVHEETVLATRKQIESRNPLAFAPKVIRTSDPLPDAMDEVMNTPASARHKRGCNCKKSSCLKKYCECYQSGVGCSVNCRCESCKNVFGTKEGSVLVASHDVDEDEETEKAEKKMNYKGPHKIMSHNNEEHDPNTFLATPIRHTRMSARPPFSSKGKPPRSSFLTAGAASGLQACQKSGIQNPPPEFHRNYLDDQDESGIPEMLLSNGSPNKILKTGSPNSKRVSSPRNNFDSPSVRRSTRKLILQSIPSFPSLTQLQDQS